MKKRIYLQGRYRYNQENKTVEFPEGIIKRDEDYELLGIDSVPRLYISARKRKKGIDLSKAILLKGLTREKIRELEDKRASERERAIHLLR